MIRLLVSSLACLLLSSSLVSAHEIRPAYFRIADISEPDSVPRYSFLLRVPTGAAIPLQIAPQLPDTCLAIAPPQKWEQAVVAVTSWQAQCAEGLAGKTIAMQGLEASITDVLVRYERVDGSSQIIRLTPTQTTFTLSNSASPWQVIRTYTLLGAEHILFGIDHLLFVLALLLIVADWRKLLATVTAFTVAHSITLGAATLQWVSLPQAPVEAVIALSILFVCMEIVHWREGRPGIARQYPWIVAFVFGLLHGFGFAGALTEIGLPQHAIPLALLFFNVGVELGQLVFIAVVLLSWQFIKHLRLPLWVWRVPVYGIGSLAGFWTIERIAAFW